MSTALPASMSLKPEKTFSPSVIPPPGYTMLHELGAGAFTTVYKAQREKDKKIFAIKMIDMKDMDAKGTDAVAREIQCHGSVNHPNIVAYVDGHLDEEHKTFAMVMGYCPGGEITALLDLYHDNQKYLPEETIWAYLRQLVGALHHCHEPAARGFEASTIILHRDIKPANILMSQDRAELKLADFGLSREVEQDEWATSFCGTPDFMPPEICAETPADIRSNEAGDVWSLGCLLYELCTLRPLFVEADDEKLKQLIRDGADPLIPATYSDELWKVLRLMLMTNPGERPSTADLLEFPGIKYNKPSSELTESLEANKILREQQAQSEIEYEYEISTRDEAIKQLAAAITEHDRYADHVESKMEKIQYEHKEEVAFYDRECSRLRKQIEAEKTARTNCKTAYDQAQEQIVYLHQEIQRIDQLNRLAEAQIASLDTCDRMVTEREQALAANIRQFEERVERGRLAVNPKTQNAMSLVSLGSRQRHSTFCSTHVALPSRPRPAGPGQLELIPISSKVTSVAGAKRGVAEAKPRLPTTRHAASVMTHRPVALSTTSRSNAPSIDAGKHVVASKAIARTTTTSSASTRVPNPRPVTAPSAQQPPRIVEPSRRNAVVPEASRTVVPRKVVAASQGPRTAVVKAVPVPVAKPVVNAVPAASSVISRTSSIATVPRRHIVTKPIGKAVPIVAVEVSKRAINIKPTSYSVVPTTDSALTMSTKRKFDQFRGAMQTASTSAEVRSCVGLGAKRFRV